MTAAKLRFYRRGRFLACNSQCADAFRTDRRYGLIYGPFRFADGRFALTWEQASREVGFCAYCGARSGGAR